MFKETSHEKLYYTEHWPSSISTIKGKISKSMKSFSNSRTNSLSNSLSNSCSCSRSSSRSSSRSNSRSCSISSSFSSIYNPIHIIESLNNSKIFSSQESLLNIIEEE